MDPLREHVGPDAVVQGKRPARADAVLGLSLRSVEEGVDAAVDPDARVRAAPHVVEEGAAHDRGRGDVRLAEGRRESEPPFEAIPARTRKPDALEADARV